MLWMDTRNQREYSIQFMSVCACVPVCVCASICTIVGMGEKSRGGRMEDKDKAE